MARALHLLICISAAMTATGYEYSYNFEPWHMPDNFRNTDSVDHTSHDRMNARSDEGRTRISKRSIVRSKMQNPQHSSADNSVLYPGPITSRQESEIKNLLQNCTALKLCEDVRGYPVDRANTIIAELREAGQIDFLPMDGLGNSQLIESRLGADNQDLCESQTKISYPQSGLDKYNNTHMVLNTKEHRIQGVQVEICTMPSQPCKKIVCNNESYECVQIFTYRPLLTIDKKYVQLAVPSSCACMAKKPVTKR